MIPGFKINIVLRVGPRTRGFPVVDGLLDMVWTGLVRLVGRVQMVGETDGFCQGGGGWFLHLKYTGCYINVFLESFKKGLTKIKYGRHKLVSMKNNYKKNSKSENDKFEKYISKQGIKRIRAKIKSINQSNNQTFRDTL